jgi:hypothetical protein
MVPIPADPQWDLEDESIAVISESLFDRQRSAGEAFWVPLLSDDLPHGKGNAKDRERSVL